MSLFVELFSPKLVYTKPINRKKNYFFIKNSLNRKKTCENFHTFSRRNNSIGFILTSRGSRADNITFSSVILNSVNVHEV